MKQHGPDLSARAIAATLAVFPDVDAYEAFLACDGSDRILDSFVSFAFRAGILPENNRDSFRACIETNAVKRTALNPPKSVTMETLLDNREDLLEIGLSGRGLVSRVNTVLDRWQIALPKISNTMLTRMKKESADTLHKQNVLRSLAFWLGFERSRSNASWNYVTLLKICQKADRPVNAKEGVRVGFSLISHGDIIEHDIVTWLKKEIKQFTNEHLDLSPHGQWGKVRIYDITTLYVDFPKTEGISELSCYQQSIRNAVSIAHQMAIRWALSPFATQKRFIVVGIAAGNFTTLDNYIQPLLNSKLPGDPAIRVSEFARQCILVNDIRAVFNDQPKTVTLFNGEHFDIWWIVGLWSSIYWAFIPSLLTDEAVLDVELLKTLLNINYSGNGKTIGHGASNAVTALLRSPQNTLLGIEITKTLYYRNKLWEALEILRIILSINPANLNARSLRMVIYRNLGSNAGAYPVAAVQFKRAEKEAAYIIENCKSLDEDFYDEYAVLKLTQAITILRFMRAHHGNSVNHENRLKCSRIWKYLDEAEHFLEIGMSVSPSGTRSVYLLICVRMLKRILSLDADIFTNPDKPIAAPIDIARGPAIDMFYAMGYLDESHPIGEQLDALDLALTKLFQGHDNSLALDAYRPTIYFCFAAAVWDFYPVRSVKTAKLTISILEEAIGMAAKCQEHDLHIYSYTRFHGEMMPPGVFIAQLTGLVAKTKVFMAHLDGSRPLTKAEQADADQFLLFSHHIHACPEMNP